MGCSRNGAALLFSPVLPFYVKPSIYICRTALKGTNSMELKEFFEAQMEEGYLDLSDVEPDAATKDLMHKAARTNVDQHPGSGGAFMPDQPGKHITPRSERSPEQIASMDKKNAAARQHRAALPPEKHAAMNAADKQRHSQSKNRLHYGQEDIFLPKTGQTQHEGKKTMSSPLKEFFTHALREGPADATFKPAPQIKAGDGATAGLDPAMDPAGAGGAGMDPTMTQDVSAMSASSLSFFAKNVASAISKYNLEQEGFDASSLEGFAQGLDGLVFQMYQGVQEPAERQSFEADYQKLAADWSKDLTKLFDKVLKLKSHSAQY